MSILLGLALTACPKDPNVLPPGPEPIPVPPPSCTSQSACECAGDRIRELDCRGKRDQPLWETPDGTPFARVCLDAMADGRHFHPECIQNIAACSELECAFRGDCCR